MAYKIRRLLCLSLFAIAMAQVEASVVVHLRSIYYPTNPLAIFPLSLFSHRDLMIELVRELATVVMILSVALLSERGFIRVFAGFVYVFGLWDIFYYVWLKLMIGWPLRWGEWDVLFLIPWPWFGPWLTPALIALLFVCWGAWVICSARQFSFDRASAALFILGVALALAAFLLPAVPLLPHGEAAFRHFQPHAFAWWLYIPGFLLMAASLWQVTRRGGKKVGE
jgi:hypothetical protein